MPMECPRCRTWNPDVARFCRNCGLGLEIGAEGVLGAGRAPHPDPLPCPDGFGPLLQAAHLYFRWEATGGGTPLLGTEPLALSLFNGGYELRQVVLRVCGTDRKGQPVFQLDREIEEWPRGQLVPLEIPSYELPDRVHGLHVELISAEFGEQE